MVVITGKQLMPTANAHDQSAGDFLIVNNRIRIPLSEFSFSYMRSSGPGGQNVNKVSTKVRLRWGLLESPSLPETVKKRFRTKHARRITAQGEILVTSQRTRNRSQNVEDCLEKLREMLAVAAVVPKLRKKTKPSRASREKRLQQKREQAAKKQRRRRPMMED